MTTAALNRPGSAGPSSGQPSWLQALWVNLSTVLGVVFTARHQLRQFDEMRRLLRESAACEETHATRSAALRKKAFSLID
jgi:hypothetical protein